MMRNWRNRAIHACFVLVLLVPMGNGIASSTGVAHVDTAMLSPRFWVARLRAPDAVLLDRAKIDARNAAMLHDDPSMHDLAGLPTNLDAARVRAWIVALSHRPKQRLLDAEGQPLADAVFDDLDASLDLAAIPAQQPTRFGLVVRRAALRTYPTRLRAFSAPLDLDIDRFQENALFPGTPVVITHRSADRRWLFVVSPRYAAWIEADAVAEGSRDRVLGYAVRSPARIVTGATVRTVSTREQPALSQLQLDMGVRLPLADLPMDAQVNGQNAYTAHAVDLPLRGADGGLRIVPALLPRTADTAADVLPLTRANIVRQAFKFLGERYGWGHDFDARDCSGFTSEVFRSMGVLLPRNTGDQARSPVLPRTHFETGDDHAQRLAALRALEVGDLVYIPGHVMLVVGRIGREPYVIHDIEGGRVLDADGRLHELHLNGVSLTPLTPLMFDADHAFIDRMTDIVHVAR